MGRGDGGDRRLRPGLGQVGRGLCEDEKSLKKTPGGVKALSRSKEPTAEGRGMPSINRIVIESTTSTTDLCRRGAEFGTDKSPYSSSWHHHPYTAVYDLLFATMRYQPILLGEVGILDNKSMHLWRSYFLDATLYGFEFDEARIRAAQQEAIPGAHYRVADVSNSTSLVEAFNAPGRKFDVLIDDSTHLFEHQINFVRVALDFVRPGGILIVEDVFREWEEAAYRDALHDVLKFFHSATFIDTQHEKAFSGGNTTVPYYNNDKLLVLYRNAVSRF